MSRNFIFRGVVADYKGPFLKRGWSGTLNPSQTAGTSTLSLHIIGEVASFKSDDESEGKMSVARPEPHDTRVIAHVDLDCFYVQVEQRRHPELKGKPTAVVMYNPWKGGGIIAVGYEARGAGVTRQMRGDDAKKICPAINLIQVPTHFGKADLSVYRDAGSEVVAVFSRGGVCERASIDEVYLDVTEAAAARLQQCPPESVENLSVQVLGSHIVGLGKELDHNEGMDVKGWLCRSDVYASRSDQLLSCGAMIVAELRTAVLEETGFTTSAGIAHNKMLAKLASGMHKPAQQTVVPSSGSPGLLASLPIKKIKGLGGKLGKTVESGLGIKTMGDLLPYSESKLQDSYGTNTGTWLWRVARGMSRDEVEGRILPKSHGCGKTFPGVKALKDLDSVAHWLSELSGELQERLDADLHQNNRTARLLVCHAACHMSRKGDNPMKPFPSKSCAIRYGQEKIASDALILFKRALSEFCPGVHSVSPAKGESTGTGHKWGVTALSISANNIIDASGTNLITQYFAVPATASRTATAGEAVLTTTPPSSPSSRHSSSPLSPSCLEDSPRQERFGLGPFLRDTTCNEDLRAINLMVIESSTSQDAAVGGLDDVIDNSVRSPFGGGVGSSGPSAQPSYDATTTHSSIVPSPDIEKFEEVLRNSSQKRLLKLGDLSGHVESCIYAGNPFSSPENGALSTEDREAGLICTPKFGVPGSPLQPLSALEFPEELSSAHSWYPALVGQRVEGHSVLSSQKLDCEENETLAQVEAITCSPLEQDSRCGIEANLARGGNLRSSEGTTSSGKVSESPSTVFARTPGPDSGFVPDIESIEILKSLANPATMNSSKLVTSSSSQSRSIPYSKGGDGTSGSNASQEVHANASKKLVFQRVDELWGKPRPTAQLLLKASRSSSGTWNYKQDEIDEGVLLELPEEIQHELRNQLGLKRQKTGRRSTIGDFFRAGSSPPK